MQKAINETLILLMKARSYEEENKIQLATGTQPRDP